MEEDVHAGRPPIPATVFACLRPGELRVIVLPGYGMGHIPYDVPVHLVPERLRVPNTKLWLSFDSEKRLFAFPSG